VLKIKAGFAKRISPYKRENTRIEIAVECFLNRSRFIAVVYSLYVGVKKTSANRRNHPKDVVVVVGRGFVNGDATPHHHYTTPPLHCNARLRIHEIIQVHV
jgi:hypothetical protein